MPASSSSAFDQLQATDKPSSLCRGREENSPQAAMLCKSFSELFYNRFGKIKADDVVADGASLPRQLAASDLLLRSREDLEMSP